MPGGRAPIGPAVGCPGAAVDSVRHARLARNAHPAPEEAENLAAWSLPGSFKGATGTIKAKDISSAKTAVTITYST